MLSHELCVEPAFPGPCDLARAGLTLMSVSAPRFMLLAAGTFCAALSLAMLPCVLALGDGLVLL